MVTETQRGPTLTLRWTPTARKRVCLAGYRMAVFVLGAEGRPGVQFLTEKQDIVMEHVGREIPVS